MEIKGRIVQMLPLQTGMGKKGEWKKLGFIMETEGQYPKKINLNVWGTKVDEYQLRVGDVATFHLDIESREYQSKWFTEIRVWKLEKHSSGPVVNTQQAPPPASEPFVADDGSSDLPF
jgi:hypothetical protein